MAFVRCGTACLVHARAWSDVTLHSLVQFVERAGSLLCLPHSCKLLRMQAFQIMEEELGRPIAEVFSSISERPIAAASLGQVSLVLRPSCVIFAAACKRVMLCRAHHLRGFAQDCPEGRGELPFVQIVNGLAAWSPVALCI